jgi:glycosyltransferase involved in cell wall biosynthesis
VHTTHPKRIFTFAGNLGAVQNLEMLVDVFGKLNPEYAELHLVGGGINLEPLREQVKANNYQNIYLPGRQPQSEMPKLFANSDVLIISLTEAFAMTLPAKFQAYIAAGKPLLGIIGGDTAHLIRQHELGIACDPTPDAIRTAFETLFSTSEADLQKWGRNAKRLSDKSFKRSRIIKQMDTLLRTANTSPRVNAR